MHSIPSEADAINIIIPIQFVINKIIINNNIITIRLTFFISKFAINLINLFPRYKVILYPIIATKNIIMKKNINSLIFIPSTICEITNMLPFLALSIK